MANTQAIATSFKVDLLNAVHQFGSPTITSRGSLTSPTADSFKAALYLASATINAATTAYTSSGEVSGTNYSAGGVDLTGSPDWIAPASSGTTGYSSPTANIVFTNVTLSTAFDAVLIYNSTQSNKAVCVNTFGSQTITAGTLTLTMPTNDSSNALIRLG